MVIIILVAGINSLRTNELLKMQLDPDEAKRVTAYHNLALQPISDHHHLYFFKVLLLSVCLHLWCSRKTYAR